jgi:CarD family transcriptional regulator
MTTSAAKRANGPGAEFAPGDYVIYPAHGLGKVVRIETQLIGGQEIKLFVVAFEQERMTMSVPFHKAKSSGLRSLSTRRVMEQALTTLQGQASGKRVIWNRRAVEYAAKINSGDPITIAEVVRDLYRNADQPERSYSERLIYEQALDRLTREVAAIERIAVDVASTKLERLLNAA